MLSMREYELLMKAVELREADIEYHLNLQAWLNVKAGAKKKAGKDKERLVYNRFDKLYDRKEAIDRIMHPEKEHESRFKGIGKLLRKQKGGETDG